MKDWRRAGLRFSEGQQGSILGRFCDIGERRNGQIRYVIRGRDGDSIFECFGMGNGVRGGWMEGSGLSINMNPNLTTPDESRRNEQTVTTEVLSRLLIILGLLGEISFELR